MAESNDKTGLLNLTVAEFNALRGEIKDRSTIAYTLMNINITATTAIAGFVLSSKADPILLLILPLLSPALGMLFVDHSYNIDNLGATSNPGCVPRRQLRLGIPMCSGMKTLLTHTNRTSFFGFCR